LQLINIIIINSLNTDTKIGLLQEYKVGITLMSHNFESYAMLWLYNTSPQKPSASPSPTKYDFEVMLFNKWQCYDNFNIQPVNCIVDGQVSHDRPTKCLRHTVSEAIQRKEVVTLILFKTGCPI